METWFGILVLIIVIGIPVISLLTVLFMTLFNNADIKFDKWKEKKRYDYKCWKANREAIKMWRKKPKVTDVSTSKKVKDRYSDYIEDRMN